MYLDMQSTVRTKDYMMDGSGGLWKCASSGNLLDYEPLKENETSKKIRASLQKLVEPYALPTLDTFGEKRIEGATKKYVWPSLDWVTLSAFKNGDNWMHNERRKRE